MRRRRFMGLIGGSLLTMPFVARAQKAPIRLGYLCAGSATSSSSTIQLNLIRTGLGDVGLEAGRDYVLEPRFATGRYERFPELAQDLSRSGVSIILANTVLGVRAAQAIEPPVAVVMVGINAPVNSGLIAGLSRPGGHTTGLATLIEDLTPKMLEFQRMILPDAATLGVILNPANPTNPPMADNLGRQASKMGMTIRSIAVRQPENLDSALASFAETKPDALHIVADAATLDLADRISAFAIDQKIPLFATYPPIAELGGLLGYGPSFAKMLARSGYYVKRIMEGANPADIPVEQPTAIELWISLKTARSLGVTIPFQLEQLADKVIE